MLAHHKIVVSRFISFMTALVAALISANCIHAEQAYFMGLGDLPGGLYRSKAKDVSADGSVVVGSSVIGPTINDVQAFRWTEETGMVSIAPFTSEARRISSDGTTILVGLNRWTADGGMERLPALPGYATTAAIDLSADGRIVVGYASDGFFEDRGVRWAGSGVEQLAPIIGLSESTIIATSADGATLAGFESDYANGIRKGFVWNKNTGVKYFANPANSSYQPIGMSADGSIVAGFKDLRQPFIWTEQSGVVPLNTADSDYMAISADGSVIVGGYQNSGPGWIWDNAHGVRNLQQVLTTEYNLGSSLTGWSLRAAESISADNRTIVGWGFNPNGNIEAFMAYLGTPVPEPSMFLMAGLALIPLARRSKERTLMTQRRSSARA
ncbi:hypothetical protein I41_25610 [Lacipirellula limnantheis]|uniref:PEP-CTERM protein-sorting domain-containing protein n=2 Tax=Lacipirellula limnantheis TaxID=2528024 RepID=A0A517TYC3_9BACT|nr:hypothetical protein I41_25610 [Lacipirellula limnantheis]